MRRIILLSVVCLAVPYFSTLFHKLYDLWEMVNGHQMKILIFSTTFVRKFLIVRRNERGIIINVLGSVYKLPIIRKKKTQISNIMKIRPVRADLFIRPDTQTDRQTDMTKLTVAFRNFANARRNEIEDSKGRIKEYRSRKTK
jgi:hypothetical protein